jgi:hypothetical protein
MHNLDAYQQIEKIKALHWIRRPPFFLKRLLKVTTMKNLKRQNTV